MSFFTPVDPKSPQAQEALKALLGTTLAELNQIDKNVVGSSSNIKGVKTDLKNVLQFIDTPQPHHQHPAPAPVPQLSRPVEQVPVFTPPPAISQDKLDTIISLLKDIKEQLIKNN